ncbi:DMT family transporter [Anatilimnocola sp. NA78]|uniref:DMT family transporter n=1 Tax=Anatilimnocola sp. NA78 TaxID=3415683 RepID=UPI003CE4EDA5
MAKWPLVLNAILIGMAIGLQPVVNAQLAKHVNHVLHAALLSFFTGTVLLALLCVGLYYFQQVQPPAADNLQAGPWWMWLGGTLGVFFITASIYLVAPLGPTTMLMCFIAGQLTVSIIVEHFGLLNVPVQPISGQRIFAVLLMACAIFLLTAPEWKWVWDAK